MERHSQGETEREGEIREIRGGERQREGEGGRKEGREKESEEVYNLAWYPVTRSVCFNCHTVICLYRLTTIKTESRS